MQKITEFLNAVGRCLTGAADLFGEYNTYCKQKEDNKKVKSLPKSNPSTKSDKIENKAVSDQ